MSREEVLKCDHEWEEDKLFKEGIVKMFFGEISNMKEEKRYICRKCKAVTYE